MSNTTENLYIKYGPKKIAIKLSKNKDVDHLQFGIMKTLVQKFDLPNDTVLSFINTTNGRPYKLIDLIKAHLVGTSSETYSLQVDNNCFSGGQLEEMIRKRLSIKDWNSMSVEMKLAKFANLSTLLVVSTYEAGNQFFKTNIWGDIHLPAFFSNINFELKHVEEIALLLADYVVLIVYVDKEVLGALIVGMKDYHADKLKKRIADLFYVDEKTYKNEYREFLDRILLTYNNMLSLLHEAALEKLIRYNIDELKVIESLCIKNSEKMSFLLILLFLLKYFDSLSEKNNFTEMEDISMSRARSRPFSFNYKLDYETNMIPSIKSTTEARKRNSHEKDQPNRKQIIDEKWLLGEARDSHPTSFHNEVNSNYMSRYNLETQNSEEKRKIEKTKTFAISASNNIINVRRDDKSTDNSRVNQDSDQKPLKQLLKDMGNNVHDNNVIDWGDSISAVPCKDTTNRDQPLSWINSYQLRELSNMETDRNSPEFLGSLGSDSLEKVDIGQINPEFKLTIKNIEMGDSKKNKRRESENVLNDNQSDKIKQAMRRDKSYSMPLGRESLRQRLQSNEKLDNDAARGEVNKDNSVKRDTIYASGYEKSPLVRLSTISPPAIFMTPNDLFANNLGSEIIKPTIKDSWPSPSGSLVKQLYNDNTTPNLHLNLSSLKDPVKSNLSEIKNMHSPNKKSHLYKSELEINEHKDTPNRFSKFKNGKVFELPNDKSSSTEKPDRTEPKEKHNSSSIFFSKKFINQSNDQITDMSMSRDYSQMTKRLRSRNYKIKTNVTGHKNEQNTKSFCLTPDSYRSIFFKKKEDGSTQSKMSMYKKFRYQSYIRDEYLRKRLFYRKLERYVKKENDDLQAIIYAHQRNADLRQSYVDNSYKSNEISIEDSDTNIMSKKLELIDVKRIEEDIRENKLSLKNFTRLAEAEVYEANTITELKLPAEQSSELIKKIRVLNLFDFKMVEESVNEYLKLRQKDYEGFRTTMMFFLNQQLLPNNVAFYLLHFLYMKNFEPLRGAFELFQMNQDINDFIHTLSEIMIHVDLQDKVLGGCYLLDYMENTQNTILTKVRPYFSDDDNKKLENLNQQGDFGVLDIFGRYASCKLSFREMLNEVRNYIQLSSYNFSGLRQADRDVLSKIVMLMPIDQKEFYAAQYAIKILNNSAKSTLGKLFGAYKANSKYYEYDFTEVR